MIYKQPSIYKQGYNIDLGKWENVNDKITAGSVAWDNTRKPEIIINRKLKLIYIKFSIPLKSPLPSSYPSTYNLWTSDFDFNLASSEVACVNMTTSKSSIFVFIDKNGAKLKINSGDNFNNGDNVVLNPIIIKMI